MNLKNLFDPYLIPLLTALIGIAIGLWTVWPEPESAEDFEEQMRLPIAEERTDP